MKRPWIKSAGRMGAAAVAYVGGRFKRRKSATKTKLRLRRRSRTGFKSRYGLRSRSNRRQRSRYVFGTSTNYVKQSHASGRRLRKNVRGAWKLLSSNTESVTQSLRLYSQFGGTFGALTLQNVSPTTTTGPYNVPLHLYELNASQNVVNNVLTAPTIGWYPVFSNPTSTGTLSWSNQNALGSDDTPGVQAALTNWPQNNDILDWVQIKTMFYAPTTRPSRIQIDIVQFKDTRLVPDATTGVSTFACAFYQAMVKQFTQSPLETGAQQYSKYLKVLDSKTFIMEPKDNTEASNTNFREVNLFYRWNRRCTYNWEDQDTMGLLTNNETQVNQGQVKTQVHPRARIFLMIRGQANNAAAISSTIMPTYDLVIRTKHSHLNS